MVPSRVHPGKFYALPQAPQQFKQMIMISGLTDISKLPHVLETKTGRADRSPGEHYQLDIEMSFVEQEDIFKVVEPIFYNLFSKFGKGKEINKHPFPKITYNEALEKYGTDKPDLRNPILQIFDLTKIFKSDETNLKIFKQIIEKNGIVKAIPVKNTSSNQEASLTI